MGSRSLWVGVLGLALVACGGGEPAPPSSTPPPAPGPEPAAPETTPAPTPVSSDLGEWGRAASVPDPSARMDGVFFVADGAPAPATCTADADCMGDTLPAPGGCCNDPTTMGAYTTAYRSWISGWRGTHCGGVECPPPPPPSLPERCYFEMRCTSGTCQSTCGH